MIVEWLLESFQFVIGLLLTPIEMIFQPLGSAAGLIELLAISSVFIPMTTLGLCLSVWLGYYVTRFAVVIANWIIGKIPSIN